MVLNTDVLREIFEYVGYSDTAAGVRLSRVSKDARSWLIPRIFKFLVLDNNSFSRLHYVHQHTPPPFGHHVETIAILNVCCVRPHWDIPLLWADRMAYVLDSWWLPPDSHASLPELHVISACCYGPANRTSISRFYLDFASKFYHIRSTRFPVLTHLGFSEFAAKQAFILHHTTCLLRYELPALQVLCLRVYTDAPDLRTTGIWTALRALRDDRILLLQTMDRSITGTNPSVLDDEEKDRAFERTRDIFRKYVSGVEDPWAVGERVYAKE
ncbi:hypothetical protein EXIGLDRAFT_691724 [Exidia glandulosa HHB12029]|uniref:F-box domain-containing protein n=1 Tax=Exidia glandulosa HHB12029 TaxID=1314781 RepID=A0A165P5Z0_EXIGL|nr:hypothetical protein EXIGLDRAFT_691724 [Exidia glandulosa HHB12029]